MATVVILLHLFILGGQVSANEAEETDSKNFFEMSIEELMEVEITLTSRKEEPLFKTPAAAYVLSNEDIRRSGASSIPEALRMVPGLEVARIDSNKWSITSRGFNQEFSDKLLVLIDGRSVYSPLFAGVYWDVQDVMLEDIERIEVIRGPGGTLWGANAVNGIINIITKSAKDTQGGLLTGGGGTEENGFTSLRYGGKLNNDIYYRIYSKYFSRDEGKSTRGFDAEDDAEAFRGGFRIDWDKTKDDHITIQGDVYEGNFGQNLINVFNGGISYLADNVDVRGTNILTRWTRTFSETSDMSLQFYYDRTERYALNLEETRDTYDIDFQHRFQLLDNHNLIWGFGYRNTGDNTKGSYGTSFDPQNRSDQLLSAFVQDEITITENLLKLIIGSKFERNNYTGFEYQPSARLLWTPDEDNTVWASFTRAVQTPARAQTDMTLIYNSLEANQGMAFVGTDDLESQVLKAYELGYRTRATEKLILDITGFYNEYDNLYSLESTTAIPTTIVTRMYDNKLYGETFGAELSGHYQATENWKLTAGYSFLEMNIHRRDSSASASREKTYEQNSPHNIFHLRSYLDLGGNLEFDTMIYYVDNVPDSDVDNYIRLDARLGWNITEDMKLSLVVQNLLDRNHREFNGTSVNETNAQRAFYAKFTYKF